MTSIASAPVSIQASTHSFPSHPCWFGEVTLLAHHLHQQGVLVAIAEQVRFARRRFGRYDVIDFVAVLFGYALSGERTLEAFYERLRPFPGVFMALFERDRMPSRPALSRFLAAITSEPVEALRTLFLGDLLARPLSNDRQTGELVDRGGGVGSSSTSMARVKPPANAPCHRGSTFLSHSGACSTSVRQATPAASVGKSSAHAPW